MIVRAEHKVRYQAISNEPMEDRRISYRARGLLAAILVKPDTWVVNASYFAANGKEGSGAIQSALRELEQYGYLVRRRTRSADGKFGWQTTVYEKPSLGNPLAVVREPAEPVMVNRGVTSTQGTSTEEVCTQLDSTENASTNYQGLSEAVDFHFQGGYEESSTYDLLLDILRNDDKEFPSYGHLQALLKSKNARVFPSQEQYVREEIGSVLNSLGIPREGHDSLEMFNLCKGICDSGNIAEAIVQEVDGYLKDHA